MGWLGNRTDGRRLPRYARTMFYRRGFMGWPYPGSAGQTDRRDLEFYVDHRQAEGSNRLYGSLLCYADWTYRRKRRRLYGLPVQSQGKDNRCTDFNDSPGLCAKIL